MLGNAFDYFVGLSLFGQFLEKIDFLHDFDQIDLLRGNDVSHICIDFYVLVVNPGHFKFDFPQPFVLHVERNTRKV